MLGDFLVVITHHGDSAARNVAKFLQSFIATNGCQVIGAKYRVWAAAFLHEFECGCPAPRWQKIPFYYERGIDRDAGRT